MRVGHYTFEKLLLLLLHGQCSNRGSDKMPDLDPTLLKYASSCFQQGYTEPEIRRFLMQAGYDPASINAAMNSIRGAPAPPTPPTPPTPQSREGAAQWGGAVPWGAAPTSSTTPPAFSPVPSEPTAQTEDGGGVSGFVGKAVKTVKKIVRIVIVVYILLMALVLLGEYGARVSRLPNGSHCTSPNGCISRHCVNGVCCEAGHQCCGEPHHCGTGEAAPRTCDFSKHYCVEKSSLVGTPVPTQVPTPKATTAPTPAPTAVPTPIPTTVPTPVPTPTHTPTPTPTQIPTPESAYAESVVMGLMLDALKIDMMMAKDNGGVTLGMITNTGVASVQINGIMTCLGESCTPTLSPMCAGYREVTATTGLDQVLPPEAGLFVSNCFNNGDDYEPKAEGEEIILGLAIDYTVVDTLERRSTDTKHVAMEVTKASTPLDTTPTAEPTSAPTPTPTPMATPTPTSEPTTAPTSTPVPDSDSLDVPSDYSVWSLTSTVPYNFSKPPGFPWNQTSYPGTEYISYARMDPLLPAIYQNWVERGLPTAEIVVMTKMAIACGACPDEEITEVKASVKIEGLTDWQEKSYASVTNEITDGTFAGLPSKRHSPTTISFSIPTSFEVFSFEQKKVPIHFKLSYKYNGEPKDWSSTETLTVGSRNDFTYRTYVADHKGKTELQDYTGLIATFVTPRDPKVQEIITKAKEYLPDRQFDNYSGKTKEEVRENVMEQVAAIYKAIQEMGVSYVSSSISYTGQQNIRLPADSIGEESANCIDGALLFASAFERVKINPLVVLDFEEGHAYVGFQIDKNEKDFVFLETTAVGNYDFSLAIKAGNGNVRECSGADCPKWIDIAQARDLGINPIATG